MLIQSVNTDYSVGSMGKRKRAKAAVIRVVYESSLLNLISAVNRISESGIYKVVQHRPLVVYSPSYFAYVHFLYAS